MEYIVLLVIILVVYLILKYIFGVNLKKLKEIGDNKNLDNIISKYPQNKEICKYFLNKLNNKETIIQEDENTNATMFLILGNKIHIANLKQNFTRIQTIAHECLHSIQDKKILWFNFIFSNIYLIFFIVISIIGLLKLLPYKLLFLTILIFLGFVYYLVRMYLENDAMIKARFLAKEYMKENNISSLEEIDLIINEYDKLNDIGIKCVNFKIFESIILKCIIFILICIFR